MRFTLSRRNTLTRLRVMNDGLFFAQRFIRMSDFAIVPDLVRKLKDHQGFMNTTIFFLDSSRAHQVYENGGEKSPTRTGLLFIYRSRTSDESVFMPAEF